MRPVKPVSNFRRYHYWSERLVKSAWEDNYDQSPPKLSTTMGAPYFGLQAQQSDRPTTRAARAAALEELLADMIARDLDYVGPLELLRGRSPMTISSLRHPGGADSGAVMLFADIESEEGKRVAVCLFGGAENVCDRQADLPLWRRFGWTCSSDRGIDLLLRAGPNAEKAGNPQEYWDKAAKGERATYQDICDDALLVCTGQGQYDGRDPTWHRGYTIGEYSDVEWLAQIYYSDFEHEPWRRPHDVVHVGAALWVRSGSPRAFIPYTPRNVEKLDARTYPILKRPLARLWYHRHGDHLPHLRDPGSDYYGDR